MPFRNVFSPYPFRPRSSDGRRHRSTIVPTIVCGVASAAVHLEARTRFEQNRRRKVKLTSNRLIFCRQRRQSGKRAFQNQRGGVADRPDRFCHSAGCPEKKKF